MVVHILRSKMFIQFCFLFLPFAGCTLNTAEAVVANYYWRDYVPGDIPCDAIEVGGRYIGQVYSNGLIPATIYPHNELASMEMGGRKNFVNNIKILCGPNQKFYWERVDFNNSYEQQMKNAVKGGFQEGVSNLFIGRAYYEGELKVGKVVPIDHNLKGCYVWSKVGNGVRLYEFDILKFNLTFTENACDHSLRH